MLKLHLLASLLSVAGYAKASRALPCDRKISNELAITPNMNDDRTLISHDLPINFTQHDIQSPNDRYYVSDQVANAHLLQRLQIDKRRRTHAHAPRLLGSVRNQIA